MLILVSVCPMSVRPSVRRRLLFVFPQYIGIYPPSVVRSLLLLFSFGCRDGGAGDIAFLRPTSLVRKFFLLVPRGGHPWRGRGPLQLPGARLPWHCGRKGQWRGLIDRDLLLLRPSWLGDMYMSTRVGPMPKNVLVSQRQGEKNGWGVATREGIAMSSVLFFVSFSFFACMCWMGGSERTRMGSEDSWHACYKEGDRGEKIITIMETLREKDRDRGGEGIDYLWRLLSFPSSQRVRSG